MARTQNARLTVTISGVATTEELTEMENRIMSALQDALAQLRETVAALQKSGDPAKVVELERALAAERAAAAELAASEAREDEEQNAALAEARAQTDAALAEITGAAGELQTITAQLSAVSTAVEETPDETPVGEVVVPDAPAEPAAPAEGGEAPAEAPAEPAAPSEEAPASPPADQAPDTSEEATVPPTAPESDSGTETGGGSAPVEGPTGPTDGSGNPVAAPSV